MNTQFPDSLHHPLMETVEIKPTFNIKNFFIIITLIIGAGMGIVAYLITSPFLKPDKIIKPLAISIQKDSPTPAKPVIRDSFQDILSKNCINTTINLTSLPIVINEVGPFLCLGGPGSSFVKIGQTQVLYDKNSKEENHEGYPVLGSIGSFFLNKDSVDYSFFLVLQAESTIGTEPIALRAIKTIKLSNYELVYVSTTINIIDQKDPRLLSILNKYSIITNGKKDVDGARIKLINQDIKATFFADPNIMQSPEKETIATTSALLSSIIGK